MGKIFVVGVGCGGEDYIIPMAKKVIAKCDILVGGSKALKLFARAKKKKKQITGDIDSILDFIKKHHNRNIAVLTSGDPGFFSILAALLKKIPREEIEIIPGISSVQLCFARIREPWQDARFLSLHGREDFVSVLDEIEGNRKVAILTDEKFTPNKIASFLLKSGVENTRAVVCENLSLQNERVIDSKLEEIAKQKFSGNCVMVVLR